MAVNNIFTFQTKNSQWTPQDINDRFDQLLRQKAVYSHDGITLNAFHVITDEDSSLFNDAINVIDINEYNHDGLTGDELMALPLRLAKDFGEGDTKATVIHPCVLYHELFAVPLLQRLPDRGDCSHSAYKLTDAEKKEIEDNNLKSISAVVNWQNNNIGYYSQFYSFLTEDGRDFYDYFQEMNEVSELGNVNVPNILSQNDKVFVCKEARALLSEYKISDPKFNRQQNELFEEHVRPYFTNGECLYGWRGLGGEEDAAYFYLNHEYNTLSRQVSFIALVGDTRPETDDYCRLWLLY